MSKGYARLQTILKKIEFINEIIQEKGGIIKALEDEKNARAAMMMHLTSVAEQFNKLALDGEFDILKAFDKRDLKGAYDIRNYIVHDYEGVNFAVIEMVIRDKLPIMQQTIKELLDETR